MGVTKQKVLGFVLILGSTIGLSASATAEKDDISKLNDCLEYKFGSKINML